MSRASSVTAGLGRPPDVGTTRSVSSVVAVLGDRRQVGRWRLPRALRAYRIFGDVHLDLRGVVVADDVVDIQAVHPGLRHRGRRGRPDSAAGRGATQLVRLVSG